MKNSASAIRYATALLDLAIEKSILDVVKKDIGFVLASCEQSKDLTLLLNSPIIKADKKASILKEIFEKDVNDLTLSFLQLLAEKRRENIIPQIAEQFVKLYNKQKGLEIAIVTTACGLDDEMRKKVYEVLKAGVKSEIEIIEKIDKNIIGGFVIKLGDTQIDSSVVRSLRNLKSTLSA